MMDELVTSLVERVPALVVLVWLVVAFLRHIRAANEDQAKRQAVSDAVIMENSRVVGGAVQVLEKLNGHAK